MHGRGRDRHFVLIKFMHGSLVLDGRTDGWTDGMELELELELLFGF